MKQNKIYSLLGLAMRGRNLVSGEFQTEDAVKKGSAMLVIVAEDAVPVYEYGTKEELGWAIGRDLRSSVGVCDAGLADALIKQLEANLPG